MASSARIAIAGAGIAGLAAALAFARQGFSVSVFERTPHLEEAGAGIQLSPNATRQLERLGVLDDLWPAAVRPEAIILRDAVSLKKLAAVPLGDVAARRWDASYLVVHRADLQAALLTAVGRNASIELFKGAGVTSVMRQEKQIVIGIEGDATSREATFDLLIGADGVWSTVRGLIGGGKSGFTGHVAWRATVATDSDAGKSLATILPRDAVTAMLHPRLHLVAYPVRAGAAINLVAVGRARAPEKQWSNEADAARLEKSMAGMTATLAGLPRLAGPWTAWPVHEIGVKSLWRDGTVVLIGDAAHAMTPFAAQGAAMAIEDAVALAALVADDRNNISAALARYETIRRPRIKSVAARGAFNQFAWHARGPVALARNLVLKLRPAERLAADLDWLYAYDAEAGGPNSVLNR